MLLELVKNICLLVLGILKMVYMVVVKEFIWINIMCVFDI